MSQENVDIARQVMEAFNRRDRDAWLRLNDPEVEFRADPEWPESETVRGRDAVWEFVAGLDEAWEPGDFEMGRSSTPGATAFWPGSRDPFKARHVRWDVAQCDVAESADVRGGTRGA